IRRASSLLSSLATEIVGDVDSPRWLRPQRRTQRLGGRRSEAAGLCHLPVALMRGVNLLKPPGFHKREAPRSFLIQRIGQIGTLKAVTFGKRAYASFLRGCRFQQKKNVIVIQYEREIADVATCEQRGDFPFECDRNLSGHN